MLIGIDLIGLQGCARLPRGVDRFVRNWLTGLLRTDARHHYRFYQHVDLPPADLAFLPSIQVCFHSCSASIEIGELQHCLDRLVVSNHDGLDLLVVTNPFAGLHTPQHLLAHRPIHGPRIAAVVHDLATLLYQDRYLVNEPLRDRHGRIVACLRNYDTLLAISAATAADCRRMLNIPARRISVIGCATDEERFAPATDGQKMDDARQQLHALGIDRPFVLNLNGPDSRKNWTGVIVAYRELPASFRHSMQLVMAGVFDDRLARQIEDYARINEVDRQLVLVSDPSDRTLQTLYQQCAVFVFPSLYEGFGLPILEAMRAGAPVVAGNNSGQKELVSDAGLLVNDNDAADISRALGRILEDPVLSRDLAEKGRERSRRFQMDGVVARTLAVFDDLEQRPIRTLGQLRTSRPRLAFFSPFPPKPSGISDYAIDLLGELKHHFVIDLFHDADYMPALAWTDLEFGCRDYRTFDDVAAALGYHGILYHMGNSDFHRFVFETLARHPGVVTLHDLCLSGFHSWYAKLPWSPRDQFEMQVARFCGDRGQEVLENLDEWARQDGGRAEACARRGIYLNHDVLHLARSVVVHDSWCLDRIRELSPAWALKTSVIPLGTRPARLTRAERNAVRLRHGIPENAVLFISLGILSPAKMNVEAVDAFAAVAREDPSALFVFVGRDNASGRAHARAVELGLAQNVRFLGHQPLQEFVHLAGAADVGVNLRRPPSHGESSASLVTLLAAGIPAIVTDVAVFSSFPDDVVCKIPPGPAFDDELTRTMLQLLRHPESRAQRGRAAYRYVCDHCSWPRVAALYAEVIDRSARESLKLNGSAAVLAS